MAHKYYAQIIAALLSFVGLIVLVSGYTGTEVLGGVLVATGMTYFVQAQLQNQSEKNRIRKQNMEETLIPVFLMLKNIKLTLESDDRFIGNPNWSQFNTDYRKFIFPKKFHAELDDIFKSYNKNRTDISKINKRYIPIINDLYESQFFNKVQTQSKLTKRDHTLCFRLWHKDHALEQMYFSRPLILGLHPIMDFTSTYSIFNISNVKIFSDVYEDASIPSGQKEYKVQLLVHMDAFDEFMQSVKKELDGDQEVIDFRASTRTLISKASNSTKKLEKHINTYYPEEPIK